MADSKLTVYKQLKTTATNNALDPNMFVQGTQYLDNLESRIAKAVSSHKTTIIIAGLSFLAALTGGYYYYKRKKK